MKNLSLFLLACTCCIILSSANIAKAGLLYTDVTEPVSGNQYCGCEKVGTAKAKSILGLVTTGDAGVKAACLDGNIKQINYIDQQIKSVLIFFKSTTTRVYGQ